MSLLSDIAETVQHVAEAIATVLNVEVEIVDSDCIRVAGTGSAKAKIGLPLDYGVLSRQAQKHQEVIVVNHPGEHSGCANCLLYKKCHYNASMIHPIVNQGKTVGTVSLITFDKEQEKVLLENSVRYKNFLYWMVILISSKIDANYLMKKADLEASELSAVVNSVGNGIVAVNALGNVNHVNKMAQQILTWGKMDPIGMPLQKLPLGKSLWELWLEKERKDGEGIVRDEKNNMRMAVSVHPIVSKQECAGAVFVIQDIISVGKMLTSFTGAGSSGLKNILGDSDSIAKLKEQVKLIAASNSTVLIQGESGTGKELFARSIHEESRRKNQPFIAINCAAIPESILESELFGYQEGAFTGAKKGGKIGKFELAQKGTLFLDEIGDLPLHIQVKLLRVLENKSFERVGGNISVKLDARLVTATNRDLVSMVASGEFREDLFYRLNVIPFLIPPLRERKKDIPTLMHYFLDYYNRTLNKMILGYSPEVEDFLQIYSWPGNVREFQNTIEYCVNMAKGPFIEYENLPERIAKQHQYSSPQSILNLETIEKQAILSAREIYGDSLEAKKRIANALGIGLTTLYRKGKKYQIPGY